MINDEFVLIGASILLRSFTNLSMKLNVIAEFETFTLAVTSKNKLRLSAVSVELLKLPVRIFSTMLCREKLSKIYPTELFAFYQSLLL